MTSVGSQDNFTSIVEKLADKLITEGLENLFLSIRQGLPSDLEPETIWNLSADVLHRLAERKGIEAVLGGILPWSSPGQFWSAIPVMERFAPESVPTADYALQLFEATPEQAFRDLGFGNYLQLFRSWACRHTSEAHGFLAAWLAAPREDHEALVAAFAEGLIDAGAIEGKDDEEVSAFLASFVSSSKEAGIRTYIRLVPLLLEKGRISEADAIECLRGNLGVSIAEAIASTATHAIGRVRRYLTLPADLHPLLLTAAADERPLVAQSLAKIISFALADSEDVQILEKLLSPFSKLDEAREGVIDVLSGTLYNLGARHPELVFQFLREWVLNRSSKAKGIWHSTRFLRVMTVLKPVSLIREMVRWIIAGGSLEDAAFDTLTSEQRLSSWPEGVISELKTRDLRILVLALSRRDDNDRVVDLLFSLVQRVEPKKLDALEDTILHALIHAVANFRISAAEQISTLKKSRRKGAKKLATKLLEFHSRLLETQRLAISLRELVPSEDRMHLWGRIMSAHSSEIMRKAEASDPGKTPLYSLLKENMIKILAPGSFFNFYDGSLSDPSPLIRRSISYELPRLQLIDPYGESIRRVLLQRELTKLRTPSR